MYSARPLKIFLSVLILCALPLRGAALTPPLGGTLVKEGAVFRVWAPGKTDISVQGSFNGGQILHLNPEGQTGIFSALVPGARAGDRYAYVLGPGPTPQICPDPEGSQVSPDHQWSLLTPPMTYRWQRPQFQPVPLNQAVIYEMHIGSFNSSPAIPDGTFLSVEARLSYLAGLGINYIELMPVHQSVKAYDWGYGPYAPDAIEATYGTPDQFRHLVDAAHAFGIGVLVDVVHNHYSRESLLGCFGAYFYPNENGMTLWGPRPNYANPMVRNFITNNIYRYLAEDHVDGFRWDASSYMSKFYDYDPIAKKESNHGLNADGYSLLQQINTRLHQRTGTLSIAENFENDASITQSPAQGGQGFDARWSGFFPVVAAITAKSWDAINLSAISASLPAGSERVIYTESHDEVGHPPRQRRIPMLIDPANPGSLMARKRSLLGAVMVMTSPGVPLIFQGQEFLENRDFSFPGGTPLAWDKLNQYMGIATAYRDLISLRKSSPALAGPAVQVLHQNDQAKVLSFSRSDAQNRRWVILVNFGPLAFSSYQIGLPAPGEWKLRFSSDDKAYSPDFGGTPRLRVVTALPEAYDGLPYSARLELAPFTALILAQ